MLEEITEQTKGKRLLFFVLLFLLTATCYSQNDMNKVCEKWMVYDQPINGYKIKIHWSCENNNANKGIAYIYFIKGSKVKELTQPIHLDEEFDKCFSFKENDTIILNRYYDETRQPYLDWRTIIGFADYNFDGMKELVVCGYPRPYRDNTMDDWLDCEDFTFYSETAEGFTQIQIEPFNSLSQETCRLRCEFDVNHKAIRLFSSGGACCYTSTTYFFRDGLLFNSTTIRHEELNDKVVHDTTYNSY